MTFSKMRILMSGKINKMIETLLIFLHSYINIHDVMAMIGWNHLDLKGRNENE